MTSVAVSEQACLDCNRPVVCGGRCNAHYQQAQLKGLKAPWHMYGVRPQHIDPEIWFWLRTERRGECLESTLAKNERGYPIAWDGKRTRRASHMAYFYMTGQMPQKPLQINHHCDNPACVRIEHIYLGTAKQNVVDMTVRGRRRDRPLPGASNPAAKYSDEIVRAVRQMHRDGATRKETSSRLGISLAAVKRLRHRGWEHVQ